MIIRAGYKLTFYCDQPLPILLKLSVHSDRAGDLITPDAMTASVPAMMDQIVDEFGNRMTRVQASTGEITFATDFLIEDSGQPDRVASDAQQLPIGELPATALPYLLGSRYCETDRLADMAWTRFGHLKGGSDRVQAIVDYVHDRIRFGYPYARCTRTALEAHEERIGVCRDFAHLAVTLCRCMNIPARYCTGYLGDIGIPPVEAPMDFSAWFEVYLEGGWHTFDARHNAPRIGRIVIARGRDAADVAISHTFGSAWLTGFQVRTEEVTGEGIADTIIRYPAIAAE